MAFTQEFIYLSSRHLNTPLNSRAGVAVAGTAHDSKKRLPALVGASIVDTGVGTKVSTTVGTKDRVRHAQVRARGVAETRPDAESVTGSGEITKLTLRLTAKRRNPRS